MSSEEDSSDPKPSMRFQPYCEGADIPITREQPDMVAGELKSFATDLNLSEDQKHELHGFLSEASEKLHEYKQQNSSVTKEDLIKSRACSLGGTICDSVRGMDAAKKAADSPTWKRFFLRSC